MLFPALPAELSREIGERGSNGEREMLRHFLENGVHNGDHKLSSGDWGSNGEWGSLFWQTGERGSNAVIGDHLRERKFRGSRK